jgi:hypothetical protein
VVCTKDKLLWYAPRINYFAIPIVNWCLYFSNLSFQSMKTDRLVNCEETTFFKMYENF